MHQAHLLIDKIAVSEQFAHDLINAAQLSNKTEVDKLISATGLPLRSILNIHQTILELI
ncbi:hypothetical protein ACQKMD_09260 [Viridibacillus sp. NPDC096237]|uniref:hypothetical protein n=1 Tax=Viridibacillus sp. NPDC096237 TaxID=3390721 RepID=UPI003D07AFF1